MINVWQVIDDKWFPRLEIRDQAEPEPEHFVYRRAEGITQKRVHVTTSVPEMKMVNVSDTFSAGLIYKDENRLITIYSWPSQAERDAAVKGAELVQYNGNGDFRFRLYAIIDKRTHDKVHTVNQDRRAKSPDQHQHDPAHRT